MARIRARRGAEIIRRARTEGRQIVVPRAGRPYHIDNEINHGINKLISDSAGRRHRGCGLAADPKRPRCMCSTSGPTTPACTPRRVYHQKPDMQLIQLVSFGCGVDAITTDEMRGILNDGGKIYTQLKIDEISNLGAGKNPYPQHACRRRGGRRLARTAKRLRQRPHIPTRSSRRK